MGLKTNLVSHWKLDESSDGSAQVNRIDSHGANTLTDVNTTASGTGKISNGVDLERANSEYLTITDAAQTGLDLTGSFTIGMWIKFETVDAEANDPLVTKWSGADENNHNYSFSFYNAAVGNGLYCAVSTTGSDTITTEVAWSPSAATWYYIGVVVVINGASSYARFFVNGAQQGSDQTFTASSLYNGNKDFFLTSWKGASNYADGIVDEVSIWSRALANAEVSQLYNSGNGLAFGAWEGASDKFFSMF